MTLLGRCVLVFLWGGLSLTPLAWGQASERAETRSTQASPRSLTQSASGPLDATLSWSELTERQQNALSPLKKLWPEINQAQKRKWLAVSRNYHDLPEEEQLKMHARMRDWVRLGPRERAQARLEYARSQTLSVDERRQRWEAYQALSEVERQQLAQNAPRQPKGAAIALRPVSAAKISPPVNRTEPQKGAGFSLLRIDTDRIHPVTLLPTQPPGSSHHE
jgi:hypothetical protein